MNKNSPKRSDSEPALSLHSSCANSDSKTLGQSTDILFFCATKSEME